MIKLSPLAIKSLSGIALSVLLASLPTTSQGWTMVKEEQLTRYQAVVERRLREQKTGEEVPQEEPAAIAGGDKAECKSEQENISAMETLYSHSKMASVETDNESPNGVVQAQYTVDGVTLDQSIASYLYQKLTDAGIGYFMPYAVLQMFQESSFRADAVSANGRDYGILQFRIEYFPGLDWSNPYAEIDLYVSEMAHRAALGYTVEEMVSAHMMSDYGEFNAEYVAQVMGHTLEVK